MNDFFEWRIADVFSVLPAPLADAAYADTLDKLDGVSGAETSIVWAEFDAARKLIRGGKTNWSGGTRLWDPGNLPNALVSLCEAASDARPGEVRAEKEALAFHWFAPVVASPSGQTRREGLKGFTIDQSLFNRLIDRFDNTANLTGAEKRVYFQIAAGLSPREAAEADNIAITTKRTQIQSLYAKLECNGQADVIRHATGQLAFLITLCEAETREAAQIEAFVRRHLDWETRLSLQRLPNGRLLRILEMGPPTGRPVLVVHGMLFPMLLVGATSHLAKAGLRLIVPIRHGYLDERSSAEMALDGDLLTASLEDIATFARTALPGPVFVLGQSNGGPIALRFVRLFPDVAKGLVILSLNAATLHDSRRRFSHRFFSGLQRLVLKPGLFGLLTVQFNKYYADAGLAKFVLRGLFGDCAEDRAILDGSRTRPAAYEWFSNGYLTSTAGIAEDFRQIMGDWRADLKAIDTPIGFVHGTRDPLVDIDPISTLAQTVRGATVVSIDGGHFIAATKAQAVWQVVSEMIEASR